MSESITVRHSFNAGDLITILPGLQKIFRENGQKSKIYQRLNLPADYSTIDHTGAVAHPITDSEGRQVCMNEKMFNALKPLIESQEYVESFEVWDGIKKDFTFDLDMTRQNSQLPLPGGSIHHWASLVCPQLNADLSATWIRVPLRMVSYKSSKGRTEYSNIYPKILINRTNRYQIPYISYSFLKKYEDDLLFVGTDGEHREFCETFKLNFPRIITDDCFVLAQAISECKFFIGNQSLAFHICDAMKIPRILEVCVHYPNTFPTGANGYAFVLQESLEYFVNKLFTKP